MHLLAKANSVVRFDLLPDPAVTEIAAIYKVTGTDREQLVYGLRDLMLRSTYAELDPMFETIQAISTKHGAPEAVRIGV